MSDELTKKLPNDVPDTEPTILTLMERLSSMQEVMDRRHVETQELITTVRDDINGVRDDINGVRDGINGVRDDINQRVQENHERLVSRIDLLRTETDAHFRKQDHIILALNDNVLHARGDQKELFERIAVLEEKVS
jgi:archaellum component FlaC